MRPSQRLSSDLHSQTPPCVCMHLHEHSSLVSLEPGFGRDRQHSDWMHAGPIHTADLARGTIQPGERALLASSYAIPGAGERRRLPFYWVINRSITQLIQPSGGYPQSTVISCHEKELWSVAPFAQACSVQERRHSLSVALERTGHDSSV